jgi:hypothetical protein
MVRKVLVVAIVAACAWVATPSQTHAQYPNWSQNQSRSQYQNRSVSRPSLSPYARLFGGGYGAVDPYMSYMRQFMPQTQRPERRDVTAASGATTPLYPTSELLRARARSNQQQAGGIAPTGSGASFMNLSHFYTMPRYRR